MPLRGSKTCNVLQGPFLHPVSWNSALPAIPEESGSMKQAVPCVGDKYCQDEAKPVRSELLASIQTTG